MSAFLDYCTAGARVAERSLVQRPRLGREERLVFVVGCPRSGTTFLGRAIGGLPGFVDFGEVTPWKAALPTSPPAEELRRILERIRRIGLARDEYLDITALATEDVETIGLSSTARSPVRVTVEVPLDEADELASLLAAAQRLIDTLRQGLGLVPDSLPEVL